MYPDLLDFFDYQSSRTKHPKVQLHDDWLLNKECYSKIIDYNTVNELSKRKIKEGIIDLILKVW